VYPSRVAQLGELWGWEGEYTVQKSATSKKFTNSWTVCHLQSTKSCAMTQCDTDQEYIGKVFIDSLISLGLDQDPKIAFLRTLHYIVFNILGSFWVYRKPWSWGVSLRTSNTDSQWPQNVKYWQPVPTACRRRWVLYSFCETRDLQRHLGKALLPQLLKYILRQHSMPSILSRCPCYLFPIQSTFIGIHEMVRSSCKFLHHLQRNAPQRMKGICLEVFFTWGGG
jgi:hypothetical protein